MKTKLSTPQSKKDKHITFKKALVGLEIGNVDEIILSYLNFLPGFINLNDATFFHILPKATSKDPVLEWKTSDYFTDKSLEASTEITLKEEIQIASERFKDIEPFIKLGHGSILEAYLQAIKAIKPEVLVLGKKSKINYHSILPKNLLRLTECSLLQIPTASQNQLKKILVPIDFSENSKRALQTALSINETLDKKATIVALNVYESPELNMYKISRSYSQYESIIRENTKDAFVNFIQSAVTIDVNQIELAMVKKDMPGFGRYIVKYSDKNNFDLIVMGSKGHSKIHYLFLGSTTEKVLGLNDRVPTLVVR